MSKIEFMDVMAFSDDDQDGLRVLYKNGRKKEEIKIVGASSKIVLLKLLGEVVNIAQNQDESLPDISIP